MRVPSGDNDFAGAEPLDATAFQIIYKVFRRGWGEDTLLARARVEQKSAVFGYHEVEQVEPRKDPLEIRQFPARNKNELSTGLAEAFEGLYRLPVNDAVVRESAIVIGSKSEESHDTSV